LKANAFELFGKIIRVSDEKRREWDEGPERGSKLVRTALSVEGGAGDKSAAGSVRAFDEGRVGCGRAWWSGDCEAALESP
jgi:hypothetical protein